MIVQAVFRTIVNSHALLRLILAVPAIAMLARYGLHGGGLGQLTSSSGEWAARLLIAALAVTPVRLLLRHLGFGPYWPMWLMKRRRDFGVAAFLYALLHVSAYLLRQANVNYILFDLGYKEYIMGWAGFAGMLILALTSNDWAVHRLGTWWKMLQRLVYAAALAVFLHWLWLRPYDVPVLAHFVPLALLEAYRLLHSFSRPAGQHPPQ